MDRNYFPEKGIKLDTRVDYVISDSSNYFKLFGSYNHLIKMHKLVSVGLQASVGWINRIPLMYDRFYLGGDHFLPRYNMVEGFSLRVYSLNVSDFATLGMTLQFNIKTDFYISARGNIFSLDNFSDTGINEEKSSYGYGVSAGYRSRLGPIKISLYTNSTDAELLWLFNFSYPF
jgi:outer membrane translocation and assembly module TamA